MDKANQKDDRVTVRLPEELRNFEAFGFKNISEYIKEALRHYNEMQSFEVIKTGKILNKISELISAMEADRDLTETGYDIDREQLLSALYEAAGVLAETKIMEESPLNYIPYPEEMKEPWEENSEKLYLFTWARR